MNIPFKTTDTGITKAKFKYNENMFKVISV